MNTIHSTSETQQLESLLVSQVELLLEEHVLPRQDLTSQSLLLDLPVQLISLITQHLHSLNKLHSTSAISTPSMAVDLKASFTHKDFDNSVSSWLISSASSSILLMAIC